jgi:hypothetical protein
LSSGFEGGTGFFVSSGLLLDGLSLGLAFSSGRLLLVDLDRELSRDLELWEEDGRLDWSLALGRRSEGFELGEGFDLSPLFDLSGSLDFSELLDLSELGFFLFTSLPVFSCFLSFDFPFVEDDDDPEPFRVAHITLDFLRGSGWKTDWSPFFTDTLNRIILRSGWWANG